MEPLSMHVCRCTNISVVSKPRFDGCWEITIFISVLSGYINMRMYIYIYILHCVVLSCVVI